MWHPSLSNPVCTTISKSYIWSCCSAFSVLWASFHKVILSARQSGQFVTPRGWGDRSDGSCHKQASQGTAVQRPDSGVGDSPRIFQEQGFCSLKYGYQNAFRSLTNCCLTKLHSGLSTVYEQTPKEGVSVTTWLKDTRKVAACMFISLLACHSCCLIRLN